MASVSNVNGVRLIYHAPEGAAATGNEIGRGVDPIRGGGDRVELSAAARQMADTVGPHPMRIEKIAQIRWEIETGMYDVDSPEKLEAVLGGLFDELA